MFRGFALGAAVLVLTLATLPSTATAGPSSRPGSQPRTASPPEPGATRDVPYPSPNGLLLRGTGGVEVIVIAIPAYGGKHAEAEVEMGDADGIVKYLVPANLANEGIHANFGRYGRVDLTWSPSGAVRAVPSTCEGFRTRHFFATGTYTGTVRLRGGGGFTKVAARRIPWRRSWYPKHYGCPIRISEGLPGPGTILEAGGPIEIFGPIHLDAIQAQAGQRVRYQVQQTEQVGRMWINRFAFARGGPKTFTVSPDFRTGEISPPAPFSGTGRFERTERARGTWRGDLSVEFLDHTTTRLAGGSFEATLHSGYYEEHQRAR